MKKRVKINEWMILLSIILLFYLTQIFLNKNLGLSNASFQNLTNYIILNGIVSLLNNPLFWSSGIGNSLKISGEVILTSSFIFLVTKPMNEVVSWRKIMKVVCYSQLIFWIQYLAEFFYIKKHPAIMEANEQQNFCLFSLKHLFDTFKLPVPIYFEYASQTLSLFELIYWFLLIVLLSKIAEYSLKSATIIILSGYVSILMLWLIFVSFLILLYS